MTKAIQVTHRWSGTYEFGPSGEIVDWDAMCDDLNEGQVVTYVQPLTGWVPWTALYSITDYAGQADLYFVAEEQGQ